MEIKDRARQQLNWFEKMLHAVPGFKGYYERELRRDSDKLQREFVVQKLRAGKRGLQEATRVLSRKKNLEALTRFDEMTRLADKLVNEIRYADRGYSGFFDLIKIKEADLDAVYQCDAELAAAAGEWESECQALAVEPENAARLGPIQDRLRQLDERVRQRRELLRGFK